MLSISLLRLKNNHFMEYSAVLDSYYSISEIHLRK
ncbi:hypothetical protein T11_17231 [Trichinella zimbabwensis]|uniref:Uncharacterized protein n=1 Tax=Trichinella zimbabwensis TaxID=268475 RepID=A0A0V1DR66_9BILA|nr:hypothetical protein T11_17231 [Trichinella zimbabwensis]